MSYTKLQDATEGSTYPVEITVADDEGGLVIPSAATWSLFDAQGNVVNGRSEVALTPASTMRLVLSGGDLNVPSGYESAARVLIIEGTYDDPDFGNGLAFRDEFRFSVYTLTEKIA